MGWTAPAYNYAGSSPANGTGNINLTPPTGQSNGMLMFMLCETANEAVSAPSGWTELSGVSPITSTDNATRLTIFWRRWQTGDTSPVAVTFSGNHIIGQIVMFAGVLGTGTGFMDAYSVSTPTVASSGTITWPEVTTTGPNRLIVNIGSHGTDTTSGQIASEANATLSGSAGSFGEKIDSSTSTGNGGGFFMISGEKYAAGASGATTATLTTGAALALVTIALKPVDTIEDMETSADRVIVPSNAGAVGAYYGQFGRNGFVSRDGKKILIATNEQSEYGSLGDIYLYKGGHLWDDETRNSLSVPSWWPSDYGLGGDGVAGGLWSYLGMGGSPGSVDGFIHAICDTPGVPSFDLAGVVQSYPFGNRLVCTPDGTVLGVGTFKMYRSSGVWYSCNPVLYSQAGAFSDGVRGMGTARAYYRLSETSGTAADDLQNNFEGTYVNSPTLNQWEFPGPVINGSEKDLGYPLFSAASSQYVRCNSAKILNGETLPVVTALVRTTATVAQVIYCERSTVSGNDLFRVSMTADGYLKGEITNDGGSTSSHTMTTQPINDGQWHVIHVQATMAAYDGMTCGVDGRYSSWTGLPDVDRNFTDTNVESWIGGDPRSGMYWTGNICHVGLWNASIGNTGVPGASCAALRIRNLRAFPTLKEFNPGTTWDAGSVALSHDGSVFAAVAFNNTTKTGAIHVYSGTDWGTHTVLTPSDTASNDYFGQPSLVEYNGRENRLVMSADGSVIAMGAPSKNVTAEGGVVYIWSGTNWGTETRKVYTPTPQFGRFGTSLAISDDGTIIAVAAEESDSTGSFVAVLSGTSWGTVTKLPEPAYDDSNGGVLLDAKRGRHLAMNAAGTKIAYSTDAGGYGYATSWIPYTPYHYDGAVYVFENTGSWTHTRTLSPTSRGGGGRNGIVTAVSMSADGKIILVGFDRMLNSDDGLGKESGRAFVFGRLPGDDFLASAIIKGTQSGMTLGEIVPSTDVAGSAWAKNSVAAVGTSDVTLIDSTSETASICTDEDFGLASLAGATFSFEVSLTGSGKMDIGVLDAANPATTVGSDAFAGVAGFFGARLDLTNNRVGDVVDGTVVSYATYDPESPSGSFTIDAVTVIP